MIFLERNIFEHSRQLPEVKVMCVQRWTFLFYHHTCPSGETSHDFSFSKAVKLRGCICNYGFSTSEEQADFFIFSWAEGISKGSEAKAAFWEGKTADNEGTLCPALSQHLYISNQCLNVTELKIASSLTRSNAISHRFLFILETAGSLLPALGCWSNSWFSHASYHLSAKQTLKKCLTVVEMVQ